MTKLKQFKRKATKNVQEPHPIVVMVTKMVSSYKLVSKISCPYSNIICNLYI